ncbi:SH3 domain-containing protein [Methyloligella halotolerans]|nr:SH3 domain-containing protein [Methyloligella halotolerans]
MRYTAATGVASLAALVVTMFGFMLAGQAFTVPAEADTAQTSKSITEDVSIDKPTSPLLGRAAKTAGSTADAGDAADPSAPGRTGRDWVEVVDAVNMRSGPSSANPIVEVQLAGAQLQLSERDGGWIRVVEPNSGAEGWVYEKYVKRISPASARAQLGTVRIQ